MELKAPDPVDLPKDFETIRCFFSPICWLPRSVCNGVGQFLWAGRSKDGLVVKSLGKGSGFRSQSCCRPFVILSVQVRAVPSPSPWSSQLWVCILGMQTVLKVILLGEKQKVQSYISINNVMYCIRKSSNQPLCWKHLCISSLITNSFSIPKDWAPHRESFLRNVTGFIG